MSEFADVIGSALGGGILGIIAWFALSGPCPVEGTRLTYQCVQFGGGQYGPAAVALFVATAGTVLGFLIHVVRT